MLLFPSRWRNAHEQAPLRETRELWFSRAPAPGGGTNPAAPGTPAPDADGDDDGGASTPSAAPSAAPNTAPGTPQPVNTGRDATRAAAADALGTPETATPSINDLAGKMKTMEAYMRDIEELLLKPEVRDAVRGLGPDERAQYDEHLAAIQGERQSVAYWTQLTRELSDWDQMRRTPEEFAATVERFHDGRETQGPTMATLRDAMGRIEDVRQWETLGSASRIHVIDQLNTAAGVGLMLREVDAYRAVWAEKLKDFKKALEEEANVREKLRNENKSLLEGKSTTLLQKFGVTFHSPLEIWEGLKMVKEAFQSAVKERLQNRAAEFALGVTGTAARLKLPYGVDTQAAMLKQVDSNDNKAKNDYIEELQTIDPGFNSLFGDGGIMDTVNSDANKARACLEYGAKKGWLYGLADQQAKPIMILKKYNLAEMVPGHWDEGRIRSYLTTLIGMNRSGGEDEAKKVADRVGKFDTLEPFIENLNKELEKTNIWGAIGVTQAAIQRAKSGEISAQMAVIVMRAIRERPNIRKYISGTEIENFGFKTFNRTPFTLSHLTIDKGQIVDWLAAGGKEEDLPSAGSLAGAIAIIEKKIIERVRETNPAAAERLLNQPGRTDLDRMVADVLATKLTDVGGGRNVSVFESDLADFRLNATLFGYMTEPQEIRNDADFYTQQSEVTYLPQNYVNYIFSVTSTGTHPDPTKTALFVGQVYKRYRELCASGIPGVAAKYRDEMRKKLDTALKETILTTKSLELLIQNAMRINDNNDPDEGKPGIPTLVANGLVSLSIFPNDAKNPTQRRIGEVIASSNIQPVQDNTAVASPRRNGPGAGAGAGTPQLAA